jgi:hypothetical protein
MHRAAALTTMAGECGLAVAEQAALELVAPLREQGALHPALGRGRRPAAVVAAFPLVRLPVGAEAMKTVAKAERTMKTRRKVPPPVGKMMMRAVARDTAALGAPGGQPLAIG